jgi:uncharacterized protein YggE
MRPYVILGVILLGLTLATGTARADMPPGTLSLSAEGRVSVAPDLARVEIGVVTEGKTAAEALSRNSAALGAVFGVIAEAGIAERDRQTRGLSVQPVWASRSSDGDQRITGYRVSNGVSVTVRDLDRLGAFLDTVVQDGANSLDGLSFGVADPQPHLDAARAAAIAEARRRAALFAEGFGVELGPIVTISESGGSMPQPMVRAEFAMAAMSAPVPVAEGEVSFTANVNVTWALDQ